MKRFANSNWLLAIGCAVGIFIAGTAIATDKADSKIIQAERFEVVDARGEVLACFGIYEGLPIAMVLFDDKGSSRIVISMLPTGEAHIALHDKKENPRVVIVASEPGGTNGIAITDQAGRTRIHLTMTDTLALLGFSDTKSVPRVEIGLKDNRPRISMFAANGDLIR